MKIEKEQFKDVKFLTQQDKYKIAKHFKRFVENGFKAKDFNKSIYEHLHLHCGFIAHYNINGFYHEYFNGSNEDLIRFVKNFLNLEHFKGEKLESQYNGYNVDYEPYNDINKVLADILITYNIPLKILGVLKQ